MDINNNLRGENETNSNGSVGEDKEKKEEKKKKPGFKFVIYALILVFLIGAGALAYFYGPALKSVFVKQGPDETVETGEIGEKDLFKGFSKLVIQAANADDNFSLEAQQSDSTGVDADSAYVLKSKEELSSVMIKDNLKIEPDIDYEIKKVNNQEWLIIPKENIEANTLLKVALSASYVDDAGKQNSRDYSWAFQVKDSFKVLHSIPREAGVSVPVNTGIEVTFSHENFRNYEDYFSIEPAVPGALEVHARTLVFVPKNPLENGKLYTVSVKAGLGLAGSDEILENDYIFTFETRLANSSGSNNNMGIYERMIETNTKQAPILQVSSYRAPQKIKVQLSQFKGADDYLKSIKERDKLPWWSYSKEDFLFDIKALFSVSSFDLDVKESNRIKYIEFPDVLAKGFYLAELSSGNNKVQVWIQVSDLAVYQNITKTDTIVWVNSAITEGPVANAVIETLGTEKKFRTDNRGVAVFRTPEKIIIGSDNNKKSERYYIKASHNDDEIILPASKISRNYWWDKPAVADDYWIYMYTDRPRYQSTDTIKYWGILKGRDGRAITDKVEVALYKQGYVDYYYRPVRILEKELELTGFGSYTGEMKLENLKPDYYTMELRINDKVVKTKYISIKPYTKPAYSLSLVPDKKIAYAGDEVKFKAKASFFEGTPVSDLKLIFNKPNGNEKFITDENGEADLSFVKSYTNCSSDYGCWPDYEYFSIEPEDSELAEIKTGMSLRFLGPDVYMQTKTTYPEAGQAEIEIKSLYYDLEKLSADNWWQRQAGDEPAPGVEIKAEVYKITYTKHETGTHYDFINKKTYKSYRYNKHEEKIRDISFQTDQGGIYIFGQAVEPETSYKIKFRIFDSQGRYENKQTHLYYYNGKYVNQYSRWSYNYYHFELEENKESFAIGDAVKAEFINNDKPMPDKQGGYLFLQLQNGLQEYRLGDNSLYEFIFNKEDVPNINLEGIYFNGRSYINTQTSYYGRSIKFDINERRLKILVEPDKNKYLPGEEASLKLLVTDKDGSPVKAEVNLNLVDEAYYAVASDSASPLETLYANVRTGSLLTKKTHESIAESLDAAEKGGCFAAGTEVLMANNKLKAIELIKEGEKIMTLPDPFSSELVTGEVTEVWEHQVGEYLLINNGLKVTPEHQMYSNYRFVDAGLLKIGDWLLNSRGEKTYINSIEIKFEAITVYNLRVEPQHTFFAGGFYVHNQEKGGGPREFFTDAALFQAVTTDANGRAETSFKLPDNVTSWRITAQGITDELYAGVSVTALPVSLPVFVEVTIGNEYLEKDKPIVRMRAFGTKLNRGDTAKFGISSDSLNFNNGLELKSSAFQAAYYPLPELFLGKHDIIYNLSTDKGNDAVKLPMTVINSRLAAQKAENRKLTTDTKITAPNNLPFAVVLIDEGQNKLYPPLTKLSWSWGDRIDQKFVRKEARVLLNKYYQEDIIASDLSVQDYQLSSGGISLLPYSSEDLELSLRVAQTGAGGFDREALAQYFFKILEDKESIREEITMALCGLAAVKKPVLSRIEAWLERDDLPAKERLYLGLALAKIGAKEKSREIYYGIMKEYGETKEPHVIIRVDGNADKVFEATALASVLASLLNTGEAEGMFDYLTMNQKLYGLSKNSENLFNLEKLDYIKSALPQLNPGPAKVVYELFGDKKTVNITGGSRHSFQLDPSEVDELKFLEVTGDVGISLRYTDALDLQTVERDKSINIKREYYANGRKTNKFSEKDLIEIRLYPSFKNTALSNYYQITDILPSGLMPVTKLYNYNQRYDCNYWYPYNRDKQKVKYKLHRDWKNNYCGGNYIKYYARAKNRGEYIAEPAVIQSFYNPDFINYSNKETITISE